MTFMRTETQTAPVNAARSPETHESQRQPIQKFVSNLIYGNQSVPPTPGHFDSKDYAAFQKSVHEHLSICLGDYKTNQMQRRIRTMAEKRGVKSFAAYFTAMQSDTNTLTAFLDTMTINVTEMLRNPDRFTELTEHVLPEIAERQGQVPLSIWSAGCSYGAEAYTLAMILHEIDPKIVHKIKGTDIDLTILSKANSVCFSEADMVNISEERRQLHFTDMGTGLMGNGCPTAPLFRPAIHLRNSVRFDHHDLLADPYPHAEYDMILCRNVLIYFTEEAKERIYHGFHQALKPGGYLFVGGTERLADHRRIGFELIRPFFYRKPL